MPKLQSVSDSKNRDDARVAWLAEVAREQEIVACKQQKLEEYLQASHPDILAKAFATWGNISNALDWLGSPHPELNYEIPAMLLDTPEGHNRVEYLMAALEYGFPV